MAEGGSASPQSMTGEDKDGASLWSQMVDEERNNDNRMVEDYPVEWREACELTKAHTAASNLEAESIPAPNKHAYLSSGSDYLRESLHRRDKAMARRGRGMLQRRDGEIRPQTVRPAPLPPSHQTHRQEVFTALSPRVRRSDTWPITSERPLGSPESDPYPRVTDKQYGTLSKEQRADLKVRREKWKARHFSKGNPDRQKGGTASVDP